VTITGNGRLIQCDRPGCVTSPLAIPPQYFDAADDTKHRWAEGQGWTNYLGGDRCPIHIQGPSEYP